MIYDVSVTALAIFLAFVGLTLAISFYFGSRAKSAAGYFAAHGQIPWFVNGIAFAGDYLSAASFLGICGMIAFYGYDGFLYSIGYLAGWIVALLVVAEPMKRLGKFTFADALNARFQSRGIKIIAGVSTLAVSLFYLIPQMVGAGVLVQPLLNLPHWVGVVMVGAVVILIVVTAGMVSTTWVQFLKGALLVVFSAVLTLMVLGRGFTVEDGGADGYAFRTLPLQPAISGGEDTVGPALIEFPGLPGETVLPPAGGWSGSPFVRTRNATTGAITVWNLREEADGSRVLDEGQSVTKTAEGRTLIGGLPLGRGPGEATLHPVGRVKRLPNNETASGKLGALGFFSTLQQSEIVLWRSTVIAEPDGGVTTVYYQQPTAGSRVLRPGEHPAFSGIRSGNLLDKLNFISLMLALFGGTASLPHILIRYYTVKDEAAARKSTIVGIACIGFFYVLTLYMGLGAMTSGALDPTDSNMAAPLLAKSMSNTLFAVISAIAFTTVLGTVSGLILASAGAVTHDLLDSVLTEPLPDERKVFVAKCASVVVGVLAIVLGILFKGMNVSYLVGWAFSVAASANLPSLIMLLFWPKVTKQGIIAAVTIGMVSSLAWILLSADTYAKIYGLPASDAWAPFSQPGLVTIPLGFATLVAVSLLTQPRTMPALEVS
ncbi:sodium/solute symporter [Botrimarina hoheduenensis]|uniref:Cation/acetate symporter ActP n=1 Tax=Botrimarina hoheduenensis TaxID=2528000 RepID=A0A5C5WD68_9BACT|nr:cation acetate symporter [Botrimarina hoheduenensis]TWT48437.1 Cation/acetate symporter ActP [Botrimarina hoheduenensis]